MMGLPLELQWTIQSQKCPTLDNSMCLHRSNSGFHFFNHDESCLKQVELT